MTGPRRSLVAAMLAVAVASCGGPRAPGSARARPRPDDAVELAALLPDEVERCVVVRPGLVPDRRRSLVLLPSLAEPSAWAPDLRPIAYAMATATGEGGRRAQRSYYRFADDARERARAILAVRWLDEPCEDVSCRLPVARWLDERTLEVARYEWPRRPLGTSSAACVQLARARPDAVELAVERATHLGWVPLSAPRPSSWTLRVEGGSLVTRREIALEDAVQARILEARLSARASWAEPALVPLGPSRRRIERDAELVTVVESRRWEELELAVEDDRLEQRASALREMRGEPVPIARVRVDDVGAVRHQVRLRRAGLPQLPLEERAAAAEELATLLERAWAAHPSELAFARTLARLSLDLLAAPERALRVADEVLARGIADDPEAWRTLRREALAMTGAEELARALAEDGIAPAAEAARARRRPARARRARRLVRVGRGRVAHQPAAPRRPRAAAGRGCAPPVRGSARRAGRVGAPRGRRAARHGADRGAHGGLERGPRHRRLATRGRGGAGRRRKHHLRRRARRSGPRGAAPPERGARRRGRLGAARDRHLHARPRGAELGSLRAAGVLAGGAFVIQRADPELASAPWPLVTRYLAQPLAELPLALFPPPTLTIRAESPELAAELRRAAEERDPGACRAAGPVLRCRRPGRPEELGEVLLRVAAARARGR
ncbi:MAG: hypothetical protein M5U28_33765 [Sandaracinaceae bacterium]|nr:hypothetical protein [Sandaracinaceae bacterium]